MDTYALDLLYSNRATLTELITVKILGTTFRGKVKEDILKEIGDNRKLLTLFNEIQDEINGLAAEYNKMALFNGLSFGAKIGTQVIERQKEEAKNDRQDD